MTALLLIISFLLHVILFMAIYQLYKQIQQLKKSKNSELHTVAEQFIAEIKEENKRLQERLSQHTHSTTSKETNNTVEPSQNSYEPISHTPSQPTKASPNSKTHHISDLAETRHEEMELSLESKILQLYQKGLNIDQIAKQLKCGRTEVELIVHLQQQLKHNT